MNARKNWEEAMSRITLALGHVRYRSSCMHRTPTRRVSRGANSIVRAA
jgi:hypothetical protein